MTLLAPPLMITRGRPSWTLPDSSVDLHFALGRYWAMGGGKNLQPTDFLSITRGTTGYAQSNSGMLFNFPSGVLRITNQGLLIEEARTNLALWSRDLTNAVWIATNVTTSLTATGADGLTNSATIVTAGAINATILQTVTLASAQRALSAWVKRRTGAGAVNISQDGITWTAITINSTSYTQVSLVATQLNPVIGFQLATNGDQIDVDFVGLEAGAFATSPIPTTTVSVTRSADLVVTRGLLLAVMGGASMSVVSVTNGANGSSGRVYSASSTQSHVFYLGTARSLTGGVSLQATFGSGSTSGRAKVGLSTDGAGRSLVANNGTLVTDANSFGAQAGIAIGNQSTSLFGNGLDGYIERLTAWNFRIPNTQLKALTI